MVTLTESRTEVVEALAAAGLKAAEYVAETVSPPLAVVVPGEPYVSTPAGSVPFGHYQINLSVLLIAGKGTNKATAEWIDTAVLTVIDALDDTDFDLTEVSQPGQVQLNGSTYLGVVLSIVLTARLG